jgi:hypothetical protein
MGTQAPTELAEAFSYKNHAQYIQAPVLWSVLSKGTVFENKV